MADQETIRLTLESEDGTTDELEVPRSLLSMLAEGDESPPEVVGDVAMFGLAQRIHSAVYHGEEEASEELQRAEELTLDLFEERFGRSFAELTGHGH